MVQQLEVVRSRWQRKSKYKSYWVEAWTEPEDNFRELTSFSPMVFKGWRDLPSFIYQQNESMESKRAETLEEEFGISGERCQEQEGLGLVAGRKEGWKVWLLKEEVLL